jgi:diketogulonate reductase-like aldo/keto reductase
MPVSLSTLPTVALPDGERAPQLGQGTWRMGERSAALKGEIAAIRRGIDLGLTLVDTAEMYGEGGAERMLGQALQGLRDKVFLVSKAYPQNAGGAALRRACENSLKRLGTDRLDLYLLHWRGSVPLKETVAGMKALQAQGKIRHWGVSNFDVKDMEELWAADGSTCAANQILFNLERRGPEYDLLPWMAKRKCPAMAYSPVEQGRLPTAGPLADVANSLGGTVFQVALAWLLRRADVMVIPKANNLAHVESNRAALDLPLDFEALAALDRAFAPPARKAPLAML